MHGLNLSQTTSLHQILSPQMQQSLVILQAPVLELRQLINQELAKNPLLEESGQDEPEPADPADPPDEVIYDPAREPPDINALAERLDQLLPTNTTHHSQPDVDVHEIILAKLTHQSDFREDLHQQLRLSNIPAGLLAQAHNIIDSLEDNGYLLDLHPHNLPALPIVQSLDPAGIAARDLRECLLLQLTRQNKVGTLEYLIVRDHFHLLGRRRYADIATALNIYTDEVQDAAENIAKLNPYPITQPATNTDFVFPELTVSRQDGVLTVTMNTEYWPAVRINHQYKTFLHKARTDPELAEYIKDKLRAGKFLLRCLDQREQTIKRIADEIVRRQEAFFEAGRAHLKPMTMAQVAEAVGVHETTVSRAVAGKYMDTPQGLIEMRSLFAGGLSTADGGVMSTAGIKDCIAELIRNENPTSPLTDDQIEEQLKLQGINIARRTVAKYRAELHIQPVAMRKVK